MVKKMNTKKKVVSSKFGICPKCGSSDWRNTTDIYAIRGSWDIHRECKVCGLEQHANIFT